MDKGPSDVDIAVSEEFGALSIWSLMMRYLRYWYVFLLMTILSLGLAWWRLQTLPIIYPVSGKVLIDQNDKQAGIDPMGLIAPLSSTAGGSISDEIEIIKSREIMSRVVTKLGLDKTYYIETRFGLKEVYENLPFKLLTQGSPRSLYGAKLEIEPTDNEDFTLILNNTDTLKGTFEEIIEYKGASIFISNNQVNKDPLIIQIAWPDDAARKYASRLAVRRINRSNVLELSIEDSFSGRAILILNELVNAYNTYVLNKNKRSARTMIEFIDDRLTIISKELFNVEKEVEDYKRRIDVPLELSSTTSDFLAEVNAKDQMIAELELKRSLLENIKYKLSNDFELLDYLPFNIGSSDQDLQNDLITQFNELLSERSRLLVSATDANPSIQIIDKELVKNRENILNWIDIKNDQLSKQQDFYKNQLSPVEDRISEVPRYERELLQIIRQQKIKETLFTYLLQRREETAITLASEVTSTTIIDAPIVGRYISPNKLRVYLMFLVIGLALPGLLFLIIEFLDKTIHNEMELKKLSETPFLGSVAKTKTSDKIIGDLGNKSVISEMIRLIRTNLTFLFSKPDEPNVVLVTSSRSGEGKTFLSMNLASIISKSDKSVIAIELDLRKPKLASYLGMFDSSVIGISNFLSGSTSDINSLIQKVEGHENFDFIASGPIPPNPSELILGEKMRILIEELKLRYDIIIIDTPPVGLVADAFLLKNLVNASIYVLRASYTRKTDVNLLHDASKGKLINIGVVLNGIKMGRGYGNYRGYDYGYYQENETSFKDRLKKFFQ